MQELQKQFQSVMLVPQTVTSGGTATANLDTIGHNQAEITVYLGALAGAGSTPGTLKLSESDDTIATNFADISGAAKSSSTSTASGSVRFDVDLRKRKRYIRLTVVPHTTSTNSNVPVAAVARFDRSDEFPAAANSAEMGNTDVIIL